MTEASPVITFTRGDLVDTKGASGQLMPNMKMKVTIIKIIIITVTTIKKTIILMKVTSPETGEILGVGETGELCFQGPNVTRMIIFGTKLILTILSL